MPPSDNIHKDFLRQVFRDEKKLFKENDVKRINVPKFEEISIKAILKMYKDDEKVQSYLPEIKAKGKQLDRKFLFNIINTIYPTVLPELIAHARDLREKRITEGNEKETIEVATDWVSKLSEIPFQSSKYISYPNIDRATWPNDLLA